MILNIQMMKSNILKKISEWPKCIDASSNKLEPHRIPVYLYESSIIISFILESWVKIIQKKDLLMIKKK